MNPLNIIKNYISQGLTPENIALKVAGNNPIVRDLLKRAKNGDKEAVEKFVRNIYKEKGINPEETYNQLINMLK